MTFDEARRCIKRGDLLSLRHALDEGLDLNLAYRSGCTLLMLAALKGHTPIGQLLFARGARINAMDNSGDTAFSLAAFKGHVKFARWLLSVGASTDCRPYGLDFAMWLRKGSGLSEKSLSRVLALLGHQAHPQ